MEVLSVVTVPFEAFVPVFHGRYARTDGPLDRSNIVNVGLQVADGQAGEYSLEVASIDAWSIGTEEPKPGTIAAHEGRTEALAKTLAKSPTAETLVRTLRSSERVLVVAEPLVSDDYGKLASIQRGRLVAVLEELAARDLRVIHVLGERATLAAGRQLDSKATQALRDRWDLPTGSWSCTLIGKDGGIKKRWQRPIDPQNAFELIDVMPMRRSEARRRSGER
ncbi:Complex I intermediate-associated protein 30 (CIA30) [Planctomycetes bacterium Poly30]|uniref:Complex I intermediate-associated protein 30 (CIA30) n=1 Tax=Saltatorellus ferox TaxID=2528018 RepID=A0A518EKW3_9BACT|nr:Complex I intermediate-associated protein 30 (CIA30) [Planctomycetes bacterium Poly30]